jgi:long-chain fatty acid transport protein
MAKFFANTKWTLFTLLCIASSSAHASAFQLLEQNVTNLGTAYSGTAALANDVSSAFFNPAGLTYIDEKSVAQSLVVVAPDAELTITSALSNTGAAPEGRYRDNPADPAAVPALHYGARVTDRLVFGLSIAPPFGTKTRYSKDSVARYAASLSEVQVIGVSPSFAYALRDDFSFAVGGDAQYVKARLNARVGTGLIHEDGYQKNSADDWGYGWHAGVLYHLNNQTRFGATYRSMVRFEARGQSKALLSGIAAQQEVTAAVDLPDTLTLSAYHELTSKWAALADVSWTRWNRFNVLQLEYSGVQTGSGVRTVNVTEVPMHFKNTIRTALGTHYRWNNRWLFRAGVARDPSPVQGQYRTARVPDSDRKWAALGAQYQWSKDLKIDFGYAHLFFRDAEVSDRGPISANSGLHITSVFMEGRYETQADLFGIQIQWDFV